MKRRDYSDKHLESLEFNETELAWHWVTMSHPVFEGYCDAIATGNADDLCEYLDDLQRTRDDIDMPRFTAARVSPDRLAELIRNDPEGI